jgi:hypothetical protein
VDKRLEENYMFLPSFAHESRGMRTSNTWNSLESNSIKIEDNKLICNIMNLIAIEN